MINRRKFFEIAAGAGAALTVTPELLRALQQQGGKLIQRAIPSTGEMLPVISFGARPVAGASVTLRPTDVAAAKEVLKSFLDNGGKVVDVLHGGPAGEQAARVAASELGIQNRFFWTTALSVTIPTLPGYAGPPLKAGQADVIKALEERLAMFKVPTIDVVMIGTGGDVATHLAAAAQLKKDGRVRYVGVHHLAFPPGAPMPPFGDLEAIMRNEQIDLIGTDYSVGDRRVEQTILPLAQERKIGVMAYFPFDRRRIFQRASSMPLPEWAAEFDAKTWAQFFLKYVVSHPAVTMVRTGTTKAEHILDNIGGGIGRLPSEAMRKRMADLVDSLPPTPPPGPPQQQANPASQPPAVALAAAILDRYVGEYYYATAGQTVTIRRDADRLFMKISGNMPESPIVARSETQFAANWGGGATITFQVGSQGRVTGALVEWGPFRIPMEKR